MAYHDEEWGVPKIDDRALFEKLILEGFQAGLSWITILRKRPRFREAFDGFDAERIARWDEAKIAALMDDPGIVRNRLKIAAAVDNAKAYLALSERQGLARFLWDFVDGAAIQNRRMAHGDVPAADAAERPNFQGAEGARLSLCRSYDGLRVHAVGRHRQRPPRRLSSPRAVRPACATFRRGRSKRLVVPSPSKGEGQISRT